MENAGITFQEDRENRVWNLRNFINLMLVLYAGLLP